MNKKIDNNKIKFLSPNSDEWCNLKSDEREGEKQDSCNKNKKALNELLLSSMQMQNIVVLSGCGTSLGTVNGPSMSKLWDSCTKKNNMYPENVENILKKLNYDFLDEKKNNIEELLSLCESYIQINPEDDKAQDNVKKFYENCKDSILKTCNFKTDETSLSAHKTFIHRLSRRRVRDSRLKVFTTNYDICFEKAAGLQGIVVIDGFSFTKPRMYDPRFFDYDIIRRNSTTDNVLNYLEGVFQLFKLHGSVNWERNANGIIEEKDATPQGACMIFPAKGKYQQSYIQPHLELMARYLSALREPNTCLLICGFGFNDNHLSEPIISAIRTNPYLKVIIVDYNAENNIEGKQSYLINPYWGNLKELSKNGEDVWFINASFLDFTNLIPDLRSLTPAEKLAQNIKILTREQ